MTKTIQKINRLVNPASFLQIDLIKGFKYIDKSGELLNLYVDIDNSQQVMMDGNSLIIKSPKANVEEMKVNSLMIWFKFKMPFLLSEASELFFSEVKKIVSVIEVSKIKRIGWRNNFVYEFNSTKEQNEYFNKLFKTNKLKMIESAFEIETQKDFKANLFFRKVIKNDEMQTPGVLFDIDISKESINEISNIPRILKTFKEYLEDKEGFLQILNESFKISNVE